MTLPKIRLPIRIRFVGGVWHNSIPQMDTLYRCVYTADGVHRYHLVEFKTLAGTTYYQYVHASLIFGDLVDRSTYQERVPVWRLNQRVLEAKLRNRFPLGRYLR